MSTITPELDEKAYGQLLRRTLPHVIRAHDECERLTSELIRLDEIEDPSPEEKELAELLIVLTHDYEERRIRKSSPQQTLHHLMEARNLTQKDLWKLRIKRHRFRGLPRQAFHQQNPGQKTSPLFSRQRRTVHLARNPGKNTASSAAHKVPAAPPLSPPRCSPPPTPLPPLYFLAGDAPPLSFPSPPPPAPPSVRA